MTKITRFFTHREKYLLAIWIGIILNLNRVLTKNHNKVKLKLTNRALWYYLYHFGIKDIQKLKDKATELVSKLDHNGSIEGLELIRNQLLYLVSTTSSSSPRLSVMVDANKDLL